MNYGLSIRGINCELFEGENSLQGFLISALLIALIFSSAQAITTKDLIFAKSPQTTQPISTVVADAMNQAPVAKGLTPDQEGPLDSRLTGCLDRRCL